MEQNAADMSERPHPDEGVMVAQLKVARAILDAQRQNPGRVHGPAPLEEVDTFYRRLARVMVDQSRTLIPEVRPLVLSELATYFTVEAEKASAASDDVSPEQS